MDPSDSFDVLVVGSGATGGWAAKELTARGHRVLVLDAGPKLKPSEVDRPQQSSREETQRLLERRPIQGRNRLFHPRNCHLFVDDFEHPYETPEVAPFNWIRARVVGGRTLLWNGVSLRLSERVFTIDEAADGAAPRWPFGARELDPHYARVESFLGVQGMCDGLAQVPDGVYLAPTAPWDPAALELARRLAERMPGCTMIHVRGLGHVAQSPRHANGYPVSSSLGSTLCAAEQTGLLELRPNSVVTRILVDPRTRRARGVQFLDRNDFTAHEAHARVIVLAASTIETIRLLFNSAGETAPDGVGNSSGLLGRYLMDHCAGPSVRAIGRPVGRDTVNFYIPHFRHASGVEAASFRGGYGLEGELAPFGPRQGLSLSLMGEMPPRLENCVRLSASRRDAWGVPVPAIDVRCSHNEVAMARDALAAMTEIAAALDYRVIERNDVLLEPGTRAHEMGGARMGLDPQTSVLNAHNQCWDTPNLFVVDGACLPTAGYQHPTLTLMALTDRACGYLSQELTRGHL